MKPLLLLTALFTIGSFSSCFFAGKRVNGNGNVVSENRGIGQARKLELAGNMDVYVSQGAPSVRVEAEENIIPYIVTDADNGTYRITTRSNVHLITHAPMKVYLSSPNLSGITVAGSGNIFTEDQFNSKVPMSLKIAGSGDINVKVNSPEVEGDIAGSGNINVSGETRDVKVNIAGSGKYRGADLKAEDVSVKIAGSGDAEVFASINLHVKVLGSGNVYYKGNAEIDKKVMGSGSVKPL